MISPHYKSRVNRRNAENNVHGTGPLIVTCWYRDIGEGLKYNHYSEGFNENHDEPPYLFESQRIAWAGGIWIGREATLVDGVVVELQ